MALELEQLRVFLALVENGTVLGAAQALGVSRSRVRRNIQRLTEALGVEVFEPTGERFELTLSGRVLQDRAQLLLDEAHSLATSVRDVSAQPEGRVRLGVQAGVPPDVARTIFLLAEERFPGLVYSAQVTDRPLDLLPDRVDLAVALGHGRPPMPCLTVGIVQMPVRLMASKAYLERRGAPRSVADLDEHRIYAWRDPEGNAGDVALVDGGSLTLASRFTCNDEHMLRYIACAGRGIVYAPVPGFLDGLTSELVPVLEDEVGTTVPLRLFAPYSNSRIPHIRAFISLFQEVPSRA